MRMIMAVACMILIVAAIVLPLVLAVRVHIGFMLIYGGYVGALVCLADANGEHNDDEL